MYCKEGSLVRKTANRLNLKSKRKPKLDSLIREGTLDTLEKLGNAIGLTHERVRQYLLSTAQNEIWQNAINERKTALENLVSQVKSVGDRLVLQIEKCGIKNVSEAEKFAFDKTNYYFEQKKWSSYSFNKLFQLFLKYKTAQDNNKKLSLKELGEEQGIFFVGVGRILKESGLEPLYGTRNRKIIPKYKKQVLERAVSLPISNKDISYFLRIKEHGAYSHYQNVNLTSLRPEVKALSIRFAKEKLTYRLASEIYEAENAGFSKNETRELMDINERIYNYAIKNKQEIEPIIINALKVLYPDKLHLIILP